MKLKINPNITATFSLQLLLVADTGKTPNTRQEIRFLYTNTTSTKPPVGEKELTPRKVPNI